MKCAVRWLSVREPDLHEDFINPSYLGIIRVPDVDVVYPLKKIARIACFRLPIK